jgi:predicted metal-dependent HD superfamily phosphohydrolase
MDLYHWQQRFEAWLSQYHGQEDAAHDISHFRRVWATAQQLAEETAADRLVILTACYFHDIVSLAKNHPERSRSSAMAAEKRWLSFSLLFLISLRNATRRFYTRLKPTVLARQLLRKAKKRKSSRMPIALRRWGR